MITVKTLLVTTVIMLHSVFMYYFMAVMQLPLQANPGDWFNRTHWLNIAVIIGTWVLILLLFVVAEYKTRPQYLELKEVY